MTECANTGECQGLSVRTGGLGGRLGVRRRQPERKKKNASFHLEDRVTTVQNGVMLSLRQFALITKQSATLPESCKPQLDSF